MAHSCFSIYLNVFEVLPFVFEIYSESDIEIKNLEIQSTSQELKNEILTYFERNATDFNSNQTQIRCYQNDFMAALLFYNQVHQSICCILQYVTVSLLYLIEEYYYAT